MSAELQPKTIRGQVASIKQKAEIEPSLIRLPSIPGEMTTTSLKLPENLSYEEWEGVGRVLFTIEGSVKWWLADWLNYGEKAYGEKYTQAVDATGLDYQTLANMAYVANAVPLYRRRENLSFSHHAEVAALEPEKQEVWLDTAESKDWTRSDLRRTLREDKEIPKPTHYTQSVQFTVEAYKAAHELVKHRNLSFDEVVCQAITDALYWHEQKGKR
jgi:hypothetical protein